MKMMDCVEVTVEKEKYVRDGVHKGMQGWICLESRQSGHWLVNFPQCGENPDIATISIMEEDMKLIPVMYAAVNEEIKARFEEAGENQNAFADEPDDLAGYMV